MELLRQQDLPYIPCALQGGLGVPQVEQLIQIVKEHRIDLIHAHPTFSQLASLLVAKVTQTPLVATLHGGSISCQKRCVNTPPSPA